MEKMSDLYLGNRQREIHLPGLRMAKQIAYTRYDASVGYIYIASSDGKKEERV